MKTAKIIIVISSVIFFMISLVLFSVTLFIPIEDEYLGRFLLFINPARVFVLMSLCFVVLFLILCTNKGVSFSLEKVFVAFVSIIYIGFLVATIFAIEGNFSRHGTWIGISDESINEVNEYLPYHNAYVSSEEDAYFEVSKMYDNSSVFVYAINDIPYRFEYEAEYFESEIWFLNIKFMLDRTMPTIFNDFDPKFMGTVKEGESEGIKYKVYVYCDDYAVGIGGINYGYFSIIKNSDEFSITVDDFVETAIEQFKTMQYATTLGEHEL